MTPKEETVHTYNTSAEALAKKFDELGARTFDIDYVFSMIEKQNPSVLEIGCGNGRDAEEIYKYTNQYQGIDISEKLIELAKKKVPGASFVVADIETYNIPEKLDVVFAFASLIHVPKESFAAILRKLHGSMSEGGLVFISLKYSDVYQQLTKHDEFGVRTYWHYSQKDIEEIAPGFQISHTTIHEIRGQMWMDVLLKKS